MPDVGEKKGFIVIHRKMLDWEWYRNVNTKVLFLHLLLTANYAPSKLEGMTIERGQRVTSLTSLSEETGLSVKQIRTALNHLNGTGETAVAKCPKFSIITIKNYEKYQQRAQTWAGEGQAKGTGGAGEGHYNNKNNKNNKYNKYKKGRKNFNSESNPSYDIDEYECKCIFDKE